MLIFKKLYENKKGAAMIEAAFILPVFLFLVFAIIEIALVLFYAFVLESAMYDTTRFSKIADNPASQVDQARQLIAERSLGLIPPTEVIITTDLNVNLAQNWQNAQPERCADGSSCPCPAGMSWTDTNGDGLCNIGPPPLELGAPGALVQFIAFYKKPIYTPMLDSLVNQSNGRHLISSGTIIRNEPQ